MYKNHRLLTTLYILLEAVLVAKRKTLIKPRKMGIMYKIVLFIHFEWRGERM
jgi:hypothetical protein